MSKTIAAGVAADLCNIIAGLDINEDRPIIAVGEIIPWFGGFVVAVLSLLVSSVISTRLFLLTLVISLICPIIDGNVIGPKVYGKTNSLHPLLVIFAVSAGGAIAGFWGIVLSLPVAIAIRTTYNFYKNDIHKKMKTIKQKNA